MCFDPNECIWMGLNGPQNCFLMKETVNDLMSFEEKVENNWSVILVLFFSDPIRHALNNISTWINREGSLEYLKLVRKK